MINYQISVIVFQDENCLYCPLCCVGKIFSERPLNDFKYKLNASVKGFVISLCIGGVCVWVKCFGPRLLLCVYARAKPFNLLHILYIS